ncbi:2-hydroxyacyl-CoA dehydratase [Yeguia hominis]|uniref:2-hydroxyacyl-CoA dehydratase n=1 Tax=Yeguia hominis TaxID=2763662 RepID=A0A926HN50_9FIRM|nr:2-hydroxyacyl-CoA dehydratase [Yeguia hominis]MBC8533837.1 2-hydroxyacyl-CoA dehydratase [Yeguia hominis]
MKEELTRVEFTKEMKKDYTLLIPSMAKIHFELLKNVFRNYGYHVELLTNEGRELVDEGLKYVHNDTCYPALLCIGQLMSALHSGKYDLHKVALMMTQTGGGCRASNYIHLLRKALKKDGLDYIPVISINLSGLEKNSGFQITLPMIRRSLATLVYGDLLMLLDNQVKPYECEKGQSEALVSSWINKLTELFKQGQAYSQKEMVRYLDEIAKSFAAIPVNRTPKVRVGIVGEIYVKYSAVANNGLERFLNEQDCEVMVPGILAFMLFKVDNRLEDIKLYGGNPAKKALVRVLMDYLSKLELCLIDTVKRYPQFVAPSPYAHLKELISGVIGYGCKMGEGWLLTAEMLELIESGYRNIVCAQPFGCLPNHIVGKGMIRKIRNLHPDSNIVPIDYDPGATQVNQENRIKLMLSVAKENLEANSQKS